MVIGPMVQKLFQPSYEFPGVERLGDKNTVERPVAPRGLVLIEGGDDQPDGIASARGLEPMEHGASEAIWQTKVQEDSVRLTLVYLLERLTAGLCFSCVEPRPMKAKLQNPCHRRIVLNDKYVPVSSVWLFKCHPASNLSRRRGRVRSVF